MVGRKVGGGEIVPSSNLTLLPREGSPPAKCVSADGGAGSCLRKHSRMSALSCSGGCGRHLLDAMLGTLKGTGGKAIGAPPSGPGRISPGRCIPSLVGNAANSASRSISFCREHKESWRNTYIYAGMVLEELLRLIALILHLLSAQVPLAEGLGIGGACGRLRNVRSYLPYISASRIFARNVPGTLQRCRDDAARARLRPYQ